MEPYKTVFISHKKKRILLLLQSEEPFLVMFRTILLSSYCWCHESGYHSLQLHITHGLHLPSCTAHTHSRPPLHQSHSCHHSLINPDCLTTPAPHSLTHIKAAHKHSPSAKSCFPRLHFRAYFPVCLSVHYLDC